MAAAVGITVLFVAFTALWQLKDRKPIFYPRQQPPKDWIAYSSREMGFEIWFPASWHVSESPNVVSISGPELTGVTVQRVGMPLASLHEESKRYGRYLPRNGAHRKATIGDLVGEQWSFRVGNFEGTWPVESIVLPRVGSTYLISSRSLEVSRGIISSFRFIEEPQTSSGL